MKNRVHPHTESQRVLWTNGTGVAVVSGDAVRVAGLGLAIACVDIAIAGEGMVETRGRFKVPKASADVIVFGQPLGYDHTNKRVTPGLAGGASLICTVAAGDGTTVVECEILNGTGLAFADAIVAASAALTNTVAATKFDQQKTIPANSLRPGDIVRIRAQVIATATNSTDTLALKAFIGATEVAAVAAVDVADAGIGIIDIDVPIRTIGAGGTCVAAGWGSIGVAGTATAKAIHKASQALDTTVANAVAIEGTWSVANAGNSCRLDVLDVEVIRPANRLAA